MGAYAAVIAAGAGIWAGEEQRGDARKARREQKTAQDKQANMVAEQQRRAQAEAEGQRKPNRNTILGRERLAAQSGPSSTLLTGSSGNQRGGLLLGQQSLLGN